MTPSVRVGNRTQISAKTVKISGTLETVNKAGRRSEKAYQLAKASSEIKRDMESILLSNQIATTGDATTARTLGGLQTWLASNTSNGVGGSAGTAGTTARVTGTDRAFTSTLLNTVIQSAYTNGGNPSILMVTPAQKSSCINIYWYCYTLQRCTC